MMRKKVYSDILPHFGVRIPSREIVPAGRIFPMFFPRMGSPYHSHPLLFRAFLTTVKILHFVIGRVRLGIDPGKWRLICKRKWKVFNGSRLDQRP